MTSPLEKLPTIFNNALSPIFLDAVLTRDVITAGDAWNPTMFTSTQYKCKAIVDTWGAYWIATGAVDASERQIIILAKSLAAGAPQPGDQITIRGETFTIVSGATGKAAVEADPALATWTCRASA